MTCAHDMAEALLLSEEASKYLPRVQGLINCPVLREVGGDLVAAGPGYDEVTRLLITGGKLPPVVELAEAVAQLSALFNDFDFQSEGDRARAIASMISPALQMGGFLKGRVPADVAEADQSQSGKTYRQKVIAALYNAAGTKVAASVVGGTTMTGTPSIKQQLAFTGGTYAAVGPAWYFIGLMFNTATAALFAAIPPVGDVGSGVVGGTIGSLTAVTPPSSITAPTTFTSSVVPIASIY